MELKIVVVDRPHLDPRILPHTLLEGVELLEVRHLHEYGIYRILKAVTHSLHLLLQCYIVIIYFQLALELPQEGIFLFLVELRLLQQVLQYLVVHL